MTTPKNLGIWMDHANAHLMELTADPMETKVIASKFTRLEKGNSEDRSEHIMHNKQQHQQSEYYKELGNIIKDFEEVLLFGPTDAKTELFNILKADHHFDKIKIETKQADKMTENQQQAFVRDHFSKQ
jgi:hypothetical protein